MSSGTNIELIVQESICSPSNSDKAGLSSLDDQLSCLKCIDLNLQVYKTLSMLLQLGALGIIHSCFMVIYVILFSN